MMKIKLYEIPEEGREYILNRSTGELNQVLKDIIIDSPYDAKIFIKPLNTKNYSVKGQIETSTQELCSVCGENFKFNTKASLNEILIPSEKTFKNSQTSRSNHVSELEEDGPGVTEFQNEVFDLGEFIHEAIALTIPFNPKPETKKDSDECSICDRLMQSTPFSYDEKISEEIKPNNPFQSLKGLKLETSKKS